MHASQRFALEDDRGFRLRQFRQPGRSAVDIRVLSASGQSRSLQDIAALPVSRAMPLNFVSEPIRLISAHSWLTSSVIAV